MEFSFNQVVLVVQTLTIRMAGQKIPVVRLFCCLGMNTAEESIKHSIFAFPLQFLFVSCSRSVCVCVFSSYNSPGSPDGFCSSFYVSL